MSTASEKSAVENDLFISDRELAGMLLQTLRNVDMEIAALRFQQVGEHMKDTDTFQANQAGTTVTFGERRDSLKAKKARLLSDNERLLPLVHEIRGAQL